MTCFKCGKPLEMTNLVPRDPTPMLSELGGFNPCTLVAACPDRCNVDMEFYREMTPKEREEWGEWREKCGVRL